MSGENDYLLMLFVKDDLHCYYYHLPVMKEYSRQTSSACPGKERPSPAFSGTLGFVSEGI